MSFPRTTDVSRHLARKPRSDAGMPSQRVPAGDSAHAEELKSPTEELSAAINSAQNSPELRGSR